MKRKWNEFNHMNIMNENKNLNVNIDNKIEYLIQSFIEKYGNNDYIKYMISIYLEPVAFVKYGINQEIQDIQPLLEYSFFDFYLCDRSYEDELYTYIQEIESNDSYQFSINPFFIRTKSDLYSTKLYKKIVNTFYHNENHSENQEKNEILWEGGTKKKSTKKWDEINIRKYQNDSFYHYMRTDFFHDFFGSRSYLSKSSKDFIYPKDTYDETKYFQSIFQKFIQNKQNGNGYVKVKSIEDIKVYLNQMLQFIQKQNAFIINEASGLSHFFQNRMDYESLKTIIEDKFVFSFGAYLDSSNPYPNRSFTNIFKSYDYLLYYTILIPEIRDKYRNLYGFMDMRPIEKNRNSGIYTFLLSIYGQDSIYMDKNANNVKNLSIFFEYILSMNSIEKIINDYSYEKSVRIEVEKSIEKEEVYIKSIQNRVKQKKYIESIQNRSIQHVLQQIQESIDTYKNIFFYNYLKMFVNIMMYLIYHHYQQYIPIVFKKYKIKNV